MENGELSEIKEVLYSTAMISFNLAIQEYNEFNPNATAQIFMSEVVDPSMEHLDDEGVLRIRADLVEDEVDEFLAILRHFAAAHAVVMLQLDQGRIVDAVKTSLIAQGFVGRFELVREKAARARKQGEGAVKGKDEAYGKLRARAWEIARAPSNLPWKSRRAAARFIAQVLHDDRGNPALEGQKLTTGYPWERVDEWLQEPEDEHDSLFPAAARLRDLHRQRTARPRNLCIEHTLSVFERRRKVDSGDPSE